MLVEQRFWENRMRVGATYFHNNFTDLIQVAVIEAPVRRNS